MPNRTRFCVHDGTALRVLQITALQRNDARITCGLPCVRRAHKPTSQLVRTHFKMAVIPKGESPESVR